MLSGFLEALYTFLFRAQESSAGDPLHFQAYGLGIDRKQEDPCRPSQLKHPNPETLNPEPYPETPKPLPGKTRKYAPGEAVPWDALLATFTEGVGISSLGVQGVGSTVGAQIITKTILGVAYFDYGIMGSKTLGIVKAPILRFSCLGKMLGFTLGTACVVHEAHSLYKQHAVAMTQ